MANRKQYILTGLTGLFHYYSDNEDDDSLFLLSISYSYIPFTNKL